MVTSSAGRKVRHDILCCFVHSTRNCNHQSYASSTFYRTQTHAAPVSPRTDSSYPAVAKMDVLKAVHTYVIKMITEVPGMKVLLLDAHTVRDIKLIEIVRLVADKQTPIVSLVTTQSELLSHEVYLTDRIDKYAFLPELSNHSVSREALNHLSCIAFLSPSEKSVDWVKQELASPRYGGYWLRRCLPNCADCETSQTSSQSRRLRRWRLSISTRSLKRFKSTSQTTSRIIPLYSLSRRMLSRMEALVHQM